MDRTSGVERAALEELERSFQEGERDGALAALAWLASHGLALDESALHGARRRAILLLAAGGDPRSGLILDGRAAASLAAELEAALSLSELRGELARLCEVTGDLPFVSSALSELASNASLSWRALACALLAEELDSDQ